MKSSDLIDQLIWTADGDLGLVHEAICACSENGDGVGANLNEVITYIITHQSDETAGDLPQSS